MSAPPPLTSIFSPPSGCLSDVIGNDDVGAWVLGPAESPTSCFPSGWQPNPTFYYSPGLCPSGYTVASSSVNSASETANICCPSNYVVVATATRAEQSVYSCRMQIADTTTITVPQYSGTVVQDTMTATISDLGQAINAWSVQVRFKASDASLLSAISAGHTPTTPPVTVTTTATPTASTSSASSGGGGLSTGAKVGIGVGVPIAVLLLAILGILLFSRRRRKADETYGTDPKYEAPGQTYESPGSAYLTPGDNRFSTVSHERSELPGTNFSPSDNTHWPYNNQVVRS